MSGHVYTAFEYHIAVSPNAPEGRATALSRYPCEVNATLSLFFFLRDKQREFVYAIASNVTELHW